MTHALAVGDGRRCDTHWTLSLHRRELIIGGGTSTPTMYTAATLEITTTGQGALAGGLLVLGLVLATDAVMTDEGHGCYDDDAAQRDADQGDGALP